MPYFVSKALLDLHDKYGGDLGDAFEHWAPKKDRDAFSSEQIQTLAEYLDRVRFAKVDCLAPEFRHRIENRIRELEAQIDPEVITILRERENIRP
jgi:hypothetical protein